MPTLPPPPPQRPTWRGMGPSIPRSFSEPGSSALNIASISITFKIRTDGLSHHTKPCASSEPSPVACRKEVKVPGWPSGISSGGQANQSYCSWLIAPSWHHTWLHHSGPGKARLPSPNTVGSKPCPTEPQAPRVVYRLSGGRGWARGKLGW